VGRSGRRKIATITAMRAADSGISGTRAPDPAGQNH
jgi:hypothetical protein